MHVATVMVPIVIAVQFLCRPDPISGEMAAS